MKSLFVGVGGTGTGTVLQLLLILKGPVCFCVTALLSVVSVGRKNMDS